MDSELSALPSISAAVDVASIILPSIGAGDPQQQQQQQPHPPAVAIPPVAPPPPAADDKSPVKTPARKRAKTQKPAAATKANNKDKEEEQEDKEAAESDLTPAEDLEDDGAAAATTKSGQKKRKKRATPRRKPPKEPIVYDIPPIPAEAKKMTTFKGRLGYACLNTVLRNKRPAREAVFCSRTLRMDTIKQKGKDYMKALGKQNMRDLATLIQWNEDKGLHKSHKQQRIKFMRMSSEMFPFASHPEYGYTLEYAQEELTAAGHLAKKYGHRLTTHPGQFTQLGSPRTQVVDNAFRDLSYHCEMIDRMGLDQDAVMIIHGGGIFENDGGKPATLQRIKDNFRKLPHNVQQRLVFENDDVCYSADDLLPLCEELGVPLVFDYHHDWIIPSSQSPAEMMPRILKTWEARGIKPKQHLSEPRPGAVTDREKRGHSDRCKTLPAAMPDDMDLMLEAKDKEQAVLEMYRIYDLEPVIYDNLRPASTEQTLATKGRKNKSPKKGGKGKKGAKEEDGEEPDEAEAVSTGGEDDQGETDFLSTVGSPGDTTASAITDGTDTEEVIKPRPSRSRSNKKTAPAAAVPTDDASVVDAEEAPSPTKRKKPAPKGRKKAKVEDSETEEAKPAPAVDGSVQAHDFVGTEPEPPVLAAKPEGL